MIDRAKFALLTLAVLLISPAASTAAIATYDFRGITNVGGTPRTFAGVFQYDDAAQSQTVYFPGTVLPTRAGWDC